MEPLWVPTPQGTVVNVLPGVLVGLAYSFGYFACLLVREIKSAWRRR